MLSLFSLDVFHTYTAAMHSFFERLDLVVLRAASQCCFETIRVDNATEKFSSKQIRKMEKMR